jgi:AraC family transcriptional regulator
MKPEPTAAAPARPAPVEPEPAEPEPACTPRESRSDSLDAVLAHIEGHLFAPLSVVILANVAGLSPFHFSRLFTARIGESVMAYVRRRRMLRAAARLARNPGSKTGSPRRR